jgi:hypothetical protein
MKHSRFLLGAAVSTFVATTSFAQTPEDMKKELDALKAQVAALQADKGVAAREESVETEVNKLSERLAAATTVDSGANKVKLTGEFRFRSTLELGDSAAAVEKDGWFNDSRVRLGFGYDFSRDVSAYAEVQSDFAYGQNGGPTGTDANSSESTNVYLYQAWVKTGNLFGRPEFSAKWGRQELVFGNQFMFGNADYYDGQSFDGVRYDWNSDSFSLTGMWFRTTTGSGNDINQYPAYGPNAVNGDGHDHDEFYSLYFTLKSIKNASLDLYYIYVNGLRGGTADSLGAATGAGTYFHTFGGRFGGTADVASGLDYNIELAYETGTAPSDADIDGLGGEAEIGVTFNKDNKFRAWIRALWLEGSDGTDSGFIALWPNRHSNTAAFRARYGAADIFPMNDIFALTGGVHFDPAKDWTVGLTGVWGQRESDGPATLDDAYGFEIDLWAEYRYSDAMTFSAGIAMILPDDQIDGSNGGYGQTAFDGDTSFLFWMQARLFF